MATYAELRQLFGNNDLKNRIEVACIIAAEAIRTEDIEVTNHANRLTWAKAAFQSTKPCAERMLMALIAANKDATAEEILGATDTAIQAKVDAAVDVFADGS